MNIGIDSLLGILGIIATIILGYAGVKYTLKYRKKTEILFLKNTSLSLFKAIVKNLDDIEINFQGKKIGENLILFKGTFFNNGNIDIDKSIVHKPLEIELPEDYSWIRHKIIGSSEGLNVTSNFKENKLIFNWDLLKEGEYFTFDSLVEYNSSNDKMEYDGVSRRLYNNLKINHRITDLKKIRKESSIPRPMSIGGMIFFSFILLLIVGIGLYYSFGQYIFPSFQTYNEVNLNSKNEIVLLEAKSDNEIVLKDLTGNEIMTIQKKNLNKILTGNIHVIKMPINYWTLSLIGFFSLFYFIVLIVIIISELRQKSLYKKLKDVADKYDDIDLDKRREVGFKLFELILK